MRFVEISEHTISIIIHEKDPRLIFYLNLLIKWTKYRSSKFILLHKIVIPKSSISFIQAL